MVERRWGRGGTREKEAALRSMARVTRMVAAWGDGCIEREEGARKGGCVDRAPFCRDNKSGGKWDHLPGCFHVLEWLQECP